MKHEKKSAKRSGCEKIGGGKKEGTTLRIV
jgi:hypothetical protein